MEVLLCNPQQVCTQGLAKEVGKLLLSTPSLNREIVMIHHCDQLDLDCTQN